MEEGEWNNISSHSMFIWPFCEKCYIDLKKVIYSISVIKWSSTDESSCSENS